MAEIVTQDIQAMKDASIHRIVGPTILLGSGTYFDYEAPEASEITIEDIAWGLAFTGRFANQCVSRRTNRRVMYSVAQHCVLMSEIVPPQYALDALMHEAGEAVCGDMTGPLKAICPDYKVVEKNCERAILARFNISIQDPDLIKLYDLRLLATERRDLMPWLGEEWEYTKKAEPFSFEIDPWAPEHAAEMFLARYAEIVARGDANG